MSDGDKVDMRKVFADAENRMQALRELGPDVLPPNLVYPRLPEHDPEGEYRCITAWWDMGESGLLLYMDWSPDLPFNTEIEFRIVQLLCSPYGSYVAPEAELRAPTDYTQPDALLGGKRTIMLDDAEDYITGWVSFDGEVTLTFPGYPFDKNDKGNPQIKLNWFDVEEFGTTLREIVRRVTYEAAAGNGQIAEDLGIDFGCVSPYDKQPLKPRRLESSVKEDKKAETDLSGCGCLVAGLLLAVAAYYVFLT